ncbi:DUF6656 family protein [Rhizobium sp. BK251]|uniref:DUF6656 family protein n=1 Tax=Rhizobium sp. BK251 TaxID=2512125 RepID=UPI00104881E5|nr:DUF6656 family protein [Rhizobium sp. BK251]TCL75879.1 hypothetical protein EV286_101423 [Rhizobium sp. BK251]
MARLRYYDASNQVPPPAATAATIHSEFLRTGKITRAKENELAGGRRYLSHEAVAELTGRKLRAAGEKTVERLNGFHDSIRFPKLIFHRTLRGSPHLGYCHVTAARTRFAQYEGVNWAFYIANFYAEIGDNDNFFEQFNPKYSRMYFAVAMTPSEDSAEAEAESDAPSRPKMVIDRNIRGNGVLFHTHDPQVAIRNVLLLGARHEQLRDIIRQL